MFAFCPFAPQPLPLPSAPPPPLSLLPVHPCPLNNYTRAVTTRRRPRLCAITRPPSAVLHRIPAPPLSEPARLHRLSTLVALLYFPAIALNVLAVLGPAAAPRPLSHTLLSVALLIIAPQLMRASLNNLRSCAHVVARRLPHSTTAPRLAKPVRAHAVLTALVAVGTLAGLFLASARPTNGAQLALLFQFIFYTTRQVRFESKTRVYRCERTQYRDIVYACAAAALCVTAVQLALFPLIASSITLFIACSFYLLKYIFVPSSPHIF